MSEQFASLILSTAIKEGRAAELLNCLFEGGSATVDDQGSLILASGDMIQQLIHPTP